MTPPFLRGSVVNLHPPDPDDAPRLVEWINRPEMREKLLFTYPIPVHEEREWLAHAGGESTVLLSIRAADDARLLGMIDLREIDWRSRVAGLGLFIGDEGERGRGAGAEAVELLVGYAFGTLGLDRVWLEVFDGNPAERLYRRLGFVEEGRFRRDTWRKGRALDVIFMARLRRETV